MKHLILLSVLIISCVKEQPVLKAFRVRRGSDGPIAWNAAMFCFPGDYKGDDTIVLSYGEFISQSLLGFDSRKPINGLPTDTLFNRNYWYITDTVYLSPSQMNYYIQKQKQYK